MIILVCAIDNNFTYFLDHEASRVHFSTDVHMNTEINVVNKTNDSIDVHLGFLMESHTYEINFVSPNPLHIQWQLPGLENPEIQITKIESIGKNVYYTYYVEEESHWH